MQLPREIQDKISMLASNVSNCKIRGIREQLTEKYHNKSGTGKSLIANFDEGVVYAISRMPATYAVVLNLLENLTKQNLIGGVKTAFDVGSGTGAGYLALKMLDQKIKINLFERDENMSKVFRYLFDDEIPPKRFDLLKDEFSERADLVVCSYVLNEIDEKHRENAFKKLFDASEKYVLLVDAGTEKVYHQMLKIKEIAENFGAKVVAPCISEKCLLKNDYCSFYCRVERSSLMLKSKSATKPYEDENYFYLLIDKNPDKINNCEFCKQWTGQENLTTDKISNSEHFGRVIRRPKFFDGGAVIVLCTKSGVETKTFKKRDNFENYKRAKKVKINDIF